MAIVSLPSVTAPTPPEPSESDVGAQAARAPTERRAAATDATSRDGVRVMTPRITVTGDTAELCGVV